MRCIEACLYLKFPLLLIFAPVILPIAGVCQVYMNCQAKYKKYKKSRIVLDQKLIDDFLQACGPNEYLYPHEFPKCQFIEWLNFHMRDFNRIKIIRDKNNVSICCLNDLNQVCQINSQI